MEEKEFEMADQLAQAQRDSQIMASRQALAPQQDNRFDGANCVECSNEMPKERIAMGRIRCTACQTQLEKRGKFFAH